MNLMTPILHSQLLSLVEQDNQKKFYKWKEWKVVRAYCLKRDHNECQICKRNGKQSRATTVHHVKHVIDNPLKALDSNNCESICNRCHNKEHPEKLGQHTKKKFWVDERW